MSCKCDEEEICEECPEWIFTLADLLMCMMGLFVLLWVLKPSGGGAAAGADSASAAEITSEEQRQVAIIAEIRDKFGYVPDTDSHNPIDLYLLRREMERQAKNGPGEKGNTKLKPDGAEGTESEVTTIRPGQFYTQGGQLTFEPRDATLTGRDREVLRQVADKITGHRNVVLVKGHAGSDDRFSGAEMGDLMQLSLDRAQAVADELVQLGVSPDVIRVQGAGPYEPVDRQAYTPDAKRFNRRVEIEATDRPVTDLAANGLTAPAME